MYRQRFPDDPGQHVDQGFTRTTFRDNPSFCDRVRASLVAVIVGIVLLAVASVIIFWNEGRAVQTAKSLQEGLESVVPLQSIEVAFEENNGKLVYLSGSLRTQEPLYDQQYGITIPCVKLRRTVEMYQWVEQEHKREINEGERTRTETTYSYYKKWMKEVIPSTEFATTMGHHNPMEMPLKGTTYTAPKTSVGNFRLSDNMVHKINQFKRYSITQVPSLSNYKIQLLDGVLFQGIDFINPMDPKVGDLRVSFDYAGLSAAVPGLGDPDVVSVIGKQNGGQLSEYQTEAGDKLDLLYHGSVTAEKIFLHEHTQNKILCWGLRFAGWLLMFIGFGCITRILVTLVDWVPILRDVVNLGVMSFNAILSISLSLTIIALGWLWYRPWLGGFILVLAALPFILSRRRAVAATNRQNYYQSTHHREW